MEHVSSTINSKNSGGFKHTYKKQYRSFKNGIHDSGQNWTRKSQTNVSSTRHPWYTTIWMRVVQKQQFPAWRSMFRRLQEVTQQAPHTSVGINATCRANTSLLRLFHALQLKHEESSLVARNKKLGWSWGCTVRLFLRSAVFPFLTKHKQAILLTLWITRWVYTEKHIELCIYLYIYLYIYIYILCNKYNLLCARCDEEFHIVKSSRGRACIGLCANAVNAGSFQSRCLEWRGGVPFPRMLQRWHWTKHRFGVTRQYDSLV